MGLLEVVKVLESYRGREKTMRTLQYGLLLLTPLARQSSYRTALETVSVQMGRARVILRLFDDLAMLQSSLAVLSKGKGEDKVVRCLEVVKTVVDQLFFPVEHLAWARDFKVLRGSSASLWHASLLLWASSLVLTILRSLWKISLLQQEPTRTPQEKERTEKKYEEELLTIIMHAADLLNALNWLPNRPWSKPFPVWQVGVFGLISSLIGFSRLLARQS